jgi:hypothetical protein
VKGVRAVFAAGLIALSPGAWACGYCVEDKVAATYDHAVVTRAIGKGHVVVFAEVSGSGNAAALAKVAGRAAAKVRDIDPGSVRVAEVPAVVSFALDAKGRSPAEALAATERASAGRFKLTLLTVMR